MPNIDDFKSPKISTTSNVYLCQFLSNLKPINDWAGLVLFYFATYDDLKPEL